MNGYTDFDAKGYAEMRDRGSLVNIDEGSSRTDSQKFGYELKSVDNDSP